MNEPADSSGSSRTDHPDTLASSRLSHRRSVALGALVLVVVTVGALEIASRVAERVPAVRAILRPASRDELLREQARRLTQLASDSLSGNLLRLDSQLGWRYAAGSVGDTITVDSLGRRWSGNRLTGSESRLVVGAWGDSFVFCTEVRDADCWLARWQQRTDSIRVLNHGVGGYGTDQALLRFRGAVDATRPDVAILGFTDDDLRRLVSVFRRFVDHEEYPLLKPRFRLDGGALVLEPNPGSDTAFIGRLRADPSVIRSLGHRDLHYNALLYSSSVTDHSALARLLGAAAHRVWLRYLHPGRIWDARGLLRPESEAFAIQLAIFQAFVSEAASVGAVPLILLLPGKSSVEAVAASRDFPLQPLVDSLKARRLPFHDVSPALARAARAGGSQPSLFAPGGHYSAAGNEVIAVFLDSLFQAGAFSANADGRGAAPPRGMSPE